MPAAAERYQIILDAEQKRRWTERARAAGLPTSEYVRRAVDAYEETPELNPTERELLELFFRELETTAREVHAMVEEICAIVDRPYDEEAVRARVAAELAANPVKLNPDVLDFTPNRPEAT